MARHHAHAALHHASLSEERSVAWAAHWGIAILAGFTGDGAKVAEHVREAERLAADLRSPVLTAWTAEISIEYASAVGDWESGLALAERVIPLARAFARRTLLPRLLVWTGTMLLGRNQLQRSKEAFDEALVLAGGDAAARGRGDVHALILANTGLAAYHLARREWDTALALGERALALADRFGYVVWAIHRLLPIIAEAALFLEDYERAEAVAARLHVDSAKMEHRLGAAWARAADALILRLKHKSPRAVDVLLEAADELDAVPFVFHAARLRRNAAQLLAEADRERAVRELRRAHETFLRLGAELELDGTRQQLRALGARPPLRTLAPGAGLSGRELEIARLVAAHRSNKEIGAALGISARTVSTHLSNIFQKLEIGSRAELTDAVREIVEGS
jgi:DNA-binding CsgD family transcriptional regulator